MSATIELTDNQKEVLLDDAKRHRWVSSGGPKLRVTCSCGEFVDNVPNRGIDLKCPMAVDLLAAFGLDFNE